MKNPEHGNTMTKVAEPIIHTTKGKMVVSKEAQAGIRELAAALDAASKAIHKAFGGLLEEDAPPVQEGAQETLTIRLW